jgi:hypothetical protein
LVSKYAQGNVQRQQQQPKSNSYTEQESHRRAVESAKYQQWVRKGLDDKQMDEYSSRQVHKTNPQQHVDNAGTQDNEEWLSNPKDPPKRTTGRKSQVTTFDDRDGGAHITGTARSALDTIVRANDASNTNTKGAGKIEKEKENIRGGAKMVAGKASAVGRSKTAEPAANKRSNGELEQEKREHGQRDAKKQRPSGVRKEVPGEIIDLACDASSDSEAEREEVEKVRTAKGILFLNHLISQEAELLKVSPIFSPGILCSFSERESLLYMISLYCVALIEISHAHACASTKSCYFIT